ncbi:MAG TPA: DUF1353 domain-containing protein [Pseudomonas sp.]
MKTKKNTIQNQSLNGVLESEPYSSLEAADSWLQALKGGIPVNSQTTVFKEEGQLFLGRFADRRYWLTRSISWIPDADSPPNLEAVVAPVGFVTDFASVPSIFWSILPPDGLWAYGAVIHDYLYWDQSTTRDEADEILDACMKSFGVSRFKRLSIKTAVKLAGWAAWDGNRERKLRGEKRILKSFPNDPTITWEKWRHEPDVFA